MVHSSANHKLFVVSTFFLFDYLWLMSVHFFGGAEGKKRTQEERDDSDDVLEV